MTLNTPKSSGCSSLVLSGRSAFTSAEAMIASLIALLIIVGTMTFMSFAGKALSGATSQSIMNHQSGNAMEFILSSVRLATSVATDDSGRTLTLGFDDNFTTDSDNDGKAYNDRDHFEQFQFRNGDGDDNTIADNSLVYLPNSAATNNQPLVQSGLRKLPDRNIFTITNGTTVLINVGLADSYTTDWNQSVELQLIAVPRNRPASTNLISILP